MLRYAACKLALVTFIIAATATSTVVAETSRIDPSWPDWLKEAMGKENDEMRFEPLSIGPIKTVMPGEITDRQETDPGQFYASAADGSGADIECWFFSDPVDIAALTANVANLVIETQGEQYGPVSHRSISHVDAGEIDGSAFLSIEWLYTVGEAPEALVGLTKVRAAERDGTSIICTHSLPGYRNSFAKGFAEIVRQLDPGPDAAVDPYFTEVHVFTLNDLRIGFAKSTMTRDSEGDTKIETTDAMLLPVSSTELGTTDSTSFNWSTPDGYLINAGETSVENGELAMDLSLWLDDDGMWVVDGSLSGKAISEKLGNDAGPASALGEMLAVRALLQEPEAAPVNLTLWIPDGDPTVFTSATVALDPASDAPGAVRMTMGPLKLDGEFDDMGSMRRGTVDVGGITLLIERVFQAGTLR